MNFLDPRLPDRFWSKVQPCPMTGCWLWTAGGDSDGYGLVWSDGRTRLAHRVSYLAVKSCDSSLELDHLCRVRCCVNPAHLEPVTHRENVIRSYASKQGLREMMQ